MIAAIARFCTEHARPARGDARPALLIISGMVLLLLTGLATGALAYGSDLNRCFLGVALFAPLSFAFNRMRAPRLALAAGLFGAFMAIAILTSLDSALLATHVRPYADAALARADTRLFFGFDWPTEALRLARWPTMLVGLSVAYCSLTPQPIVLIGLFAFCRRDGQGWTFVTAWGLALSACLLIFPWVPAVGGYIHFHITPAMTPGVHCAAAWQAADLLNALRDGTLQVLDQRSLGGIITMPSFHAASAVLLGWGFWSFRIWRWPLALLNAAMWLSAVPIGGHYLVDVLAGSAVAIVSIRIAGRIHATGPSINPSRRCRNAPLPA